MTFFPGRHKNGLFYSEAWLEAWDRAWGDHPTLRPQQDSSLPLYLTRSLKKKLFPVTTALPRGASGPGLRSIRAEYLCLPDDPAALIKRALAQRWDQWVLPDIIASPEKLTSLIAQAKAHGLMAIALARDPAYAVDLRTGGFGDYLQSLGKHSRLRLYNRRKRLAEQGEPVLENLWPDKTRFLTLLNDFHSARWGKPCFDGRNLTQVSALLSALHNAGAEIDLSVLSIRREPLSVALDIAVNGRCYNLQSGYKEDALKGVSLGTLHFGYQIERAFACGRDHYDFMAGTGKNINYKAALANTQQDLITLALVRSAPLKLAYRLRGYASLSAAPTSDSTTPADAATPQSSA